MQKETFPDLAEQASAPTPELLKIEDLNPQEFRVYRKTGTTKARALTEADFKERGGIVTTLEGPATFKVGDYLAVGVKGEEWPIRAETMTETKKMVGEPDENGWANFETTTTVKAIRIDKPFAVKRVGTEDVSVGKLGDYLVDSGKRQFIVAGEIFIETYTEMSED